MNNNFFFSKHKINLRYYELISRSYPGFTDCLLPCAAHPVCSRQIPKSVPLTVCRCSCNKESQCLPDGNFFLASAATQKRATSTCQTSTSTTVYNGEFPPHHTLSPPQYTPLGAAETKHAEAVPADTFTSTSTCQTTTCTTVMVNKKYKRQCVWHPRRGSQPQC